MTTENEKKIKEPTGPLIDYDAVDRLMAQVDAEGLELLGPDRSADRVDVSDHEPGPRS